MNECVRITVLVENSVHRPGLMAEHGLSFHVQIGRHNILFDTGQTELVVRNAKALGLDLSQLEAIVLSHGHYDHTGGVPAILGIAPKARVYAHPSAFEMKYSKRTADEARFIGMSLTTTQAIRHSPCGFTETRGWTEILTRVFATGEIPRETVYEDVGGPFFLDAACTQPDLIRDDQALVIDLGRRVVLLLGCVHSGVANTIDRVQYLTGGKPLCAVIGGLHLGSANEERIQQTIARLRSINLECLAPERVKAMCEHLFARLLATGDSDPLQKTIIFCASDAHADQVAIQLNNLYARWCKDNGQKRVPTYAFKCMSSVNGQSLIPEKAMGSNLNS